MNTNRRILSVVALISGLMFFAACSDDSGSEQQAEAGPATDSVATLEIVGSDCEPEGDLRYVCGLQNPEDLLLLGDTGSILVSGMSGEDITGHIYLVNPQDDSYEILFPGEDPTIALDSDAFPTCPGPLNVDKFSAHGLALSEYADNQFQLYITSHGEREAIEVFDLDASGASTSISWRGCVVLPENTFSNSVAILSDGGFVTTKMMDPTAGFASIGSGEITGNVYEWHPGGEVFMMEGTELSGANGIEVSSDDRFVYVAAFGTREIVRFDRSESPAVKAVVSVDITPDNIRWGDEGKLLTAGGNYVSPDECQGQDCATGWSVVELDAETLVPARVGGADQNVAIQGVSSALSVGDSFWVGTFNGDRVAYFPK
jgi:hypothetical protein